ncbi:iron-containing alcohol dehydrogenase [Vallitalea okinawensis]|uniref:iron-containing alcohol dehydrogenase n=1 Tax=Vallitalea okinawensis TaxID=2078660 RepID=UPI001FA8F6F6|nr:iron-containing alcohol dehydrogenase [Vallitalea okinawensis]
MTWTLKKAMYRGYHKIAKRIIAKQEFPIPELLTGAGCLKNLPELVKEYGVHKLLIVTDKVLVSLGLLDELIEGLKEAEIDFIIYDGVLPNPTIENVECAKEMFESNHCEGFIGFGGGSPMDCCKLAAARVANPNKTIRDMSGYFKVKIPLAPLFAVPTTSGTGSETTVAALATDTLTHEKLIVGDLKLVPKVAVLDPELTLGLPSHITAATGMDALTHAVEAYIGIHGTEFTDEHAEKATQIIYNYLERAYVNGEDIEAREQMALAAYHGGLAFTRASVGYVHAIAHNLGGMYGVPHGLANAVVLPYVLEYYGETIEEKLAKLAIVGGIGKQGESHQALATKFIDQVKVMNKEMQIPTKIKDLKADDIDIIAERALKEGNPTYPVPKIMSKEDCIAVLRKLLR